MAAITLDVGANTRRAERDIQKLVNRSYNINLRTKGDQPLGRITGKVNEFTKSLDASNARVIAFGASAGIIYGLERAFVALVSSTIEVQKSLQDINVILNVSTQNLQKFGAELFGIARNTGQSFQEVAKAATEFSRQGLGVEETLKRTNEALILSRLSGLDAAKSVEALTAAVNSFASQAVTATEVVNKFANVDAAFAVSSADLAEAIARVGSSAAQSGVSLNELIAIVTSAQQTTARGGAVIGNSFKTIFTRLQRGKVVSLLESLGISSTDSSGQLKSTIQLLQDLGRVYDTLGSQQQAYVAEQVGGVFQINILKAALADLGKEYSIYSSALDVAANATDQAIRRNEELNKTYAAQVNALKENARELAAGAGTRLLGPSVDRLVGGTNTLLEGFKESDGQSVGAILGKGILDGLGQFIAGPGLALIGGVLLKLFRDLGKFATGSFQQLLGLNTAATQQRDLQQSIQQILSKNPQLLELALKGEQGLNTAANSLLASLQKQTVELQKQAQVAAQISKAFISQAGVRVAGGVPVVPTGRPGKAAGFIPNFADAEIMAAKSERYNAQRSFEVNNPVLGRITVNNREKTNAIPVAGYPAGSFVVNPNQLGEVKGIPLEPIEKMKNKASGFIPNFAPKPQNIDLSIIPSLRQAKTRFGVLYPQGGDSAKPFSQPLNTLAGLRGRTDVPGSARITLPYKSIYPITKEEISSVDDIFDKSTDQYLSGGMTNLAKDIANTINRQSKGEIKAKENRVSAKSLPRGAKGDIFEAAVKGATRDLKISAKEGNQENFDFDPISAYPALKGLFGFTGKGNSAVEAKIGESAAKNIPNKILNQYPAARRELFKMLGVDKSEAKPKPKTNQKALQIKGFKSPQYSGPTGLAAGFIPNFAGAIQEAIAEKNAKKRELEAGASPGQIRMGTSPDLKTRFNPKGRAVWSTKFENSLPEGIRMAEKAGINPKTKGMSAASGFIPNFAIEDPDVQAANLGSSIGAVASQLGFLAIGLRGSGEDYKNSLKELTKTNVSNAQIASKNLREQTKNLTAFASPLDPKTRSSSRTPGEQAQRKVLANQLRESRNAEKKAAAGTAGQKFGAGLSSAGLSLALGAPIIAETIKNSIGQETAGARQAGAAVSTVGQIASFAGAGAMFGPWGAAIGAATGALLTVPSLIDEMTATAPEFAAAAKKASEDLTKFNEAGQRVLTSSAELSKLLQEGGSQDLIKKAQEAYNKSLSELSSVDRQRLASAAKVGKLEEEYAQILAEKVQREKSAQSETELAGVRDQIASSKVKTGITAAAVTSAILPSIAPTIAPYVGRIIAQNRDYLSLGTEEGRKRRAGIAETFTTELQGAKSPEEFLKSLRDIKIPKEVTNKQQLDNFIDGLKELPVGFRNTLKEIGANDPAAVFQLLRAQIIYLRKDTADFIKDSAALQTAENERQAVLKQEQAAIDATISKIQKNIAIQNLWRSSLENLGEGMRGFLNNLKIEQELTQPRQTLEKIIGSDKTPVRRLAAQEGLAGIQEQQRAATSGATINFKENIRGILEKPFQENIDKIVADLGSKGSSLSDRSSKSIKTAGAEARTASKEQFNLLNQTMKSVEGYMAQFVAGQISTKQLLEQSRAALSGVGIDVSRGTQASNDIERAVAELEVKSVQEQVKAFQQRAKLASETKQAILQSKIDAALGTFGGFEGFMGRPDEEKNYIQRISPDLQKIEEIRSSPTFRYNYRQAREEQARQSPELGRAFANVYKELINQSGGAFRNVIQNSIDSGLQQTGVESRGGKPGASKLGGFDDIVRGRAQDIKEQLKLAEDQLKVTTDPVLKRDLQGFIDEINKLGIEDIAKLQTMQEFGVARQSDFEKVYGKFENQSIDELAKISPELAELARGITFGDPLLREAEAQTLAQGKILDIINRIATDSGIETGITPSTLTEKAIQDAVKTGATPVLTEGQAKAEADKKAAEVQKQALPQDNRTTAEIEAEAIEARDRAHSMGMSLNEYRQQYPKGAPQIGPQPSPDYEKYQELNKPRPEGFQNLDDMLLNNSQRSNYKKTGKILSPEELGFQELKKIAAPEIKQQSFTQQEAAFNNNTSALTTLTGGIESLNATLSNFEANFGNLNNVPNAQAGSSQPAGAQPNITTTTTAPLSVFVDARGGNDIAAAVGAEIEEAIPEIIERVRVAMGEKVPPKTPKKKRGRR